MVVIVVAISVVAIYMLAVDFSLYEFCLTFAVSRHDRQTEQQAAADNLSHSWAGASKSTKKKQNKSKTYCGEIAKNHKDCMRWRHLQQSPSAMCGTATFHICQQYL